MKAAAISTAVLLLTLAGCGGGSGGDETATHAETGATAAQTTSGVTGKLPPGSVEPANPEEQAAEGPAATEANPGVPPVGPKANGELSGKAGSSARTAVADYVRSLNRHDARAVCGLLAPGALDLAVLPKRRGGCVRSLGASIGTPPRGGGPAWRKTTLGPRWDLPGSAVQSTLSKLRCGPPCRWLGP